MFKFLFGKKAVTAVKETQRETVERALGEVNDVLGGMAAKAKISVDLETGLLAIDLPEQMPDEALALPAPEATPHVDAAEKDTDVEDQKAAA